MGRLKKKQKAPAAKKPGIIASFFSAMAARAAGSALRHVWILLLIVGVVWGVSRLEAVVAARPEYQTPAKIHLVDVPDGLMTPIKNVVEPAAQGPWIAADLCRRIGTALETSAWVERVREVRRLADGSVVIRCAYRTPAALVQSEGAFYMLSADGIRLPGRYGYHPSLVLIQGAASMPPDEGAKWPGEDIEAGIKLVRLLKEKPFFDQITGVLVHNFGGRRNRQEPHILLATAPSGSQIAWGSAPGREVEENSIDEKIELLWQNFRRFGRMDAGLDYVDISTFPDRFTTPDRT